MIKSSFYILSLLVLASCASTKLTENEGFLSISSSKEKIYILTVLPPNGEKASNYISTLLVGHSEGRKQQFSALASYYYKLNDDSENTYCFIDSLPNWGSKRFPLLVQSAIEDSTKSKFQFSLDRKRTKFSSTTEEINITYNIHYKRQKEFNTKVIGTAFQLARVEPMSVKIKKLNGKRIDQHSVLLLHTLEKPESLFATKLHYYWIDFRFFDQQEAFSVFLSQDESGFVQVIYSSYPKEKYQTININDESLDSNKAAYLEFIGANPAENLQVIVFNRSLRSTKTSVTEPVQLKQENVVVGNGMVYKL